jgi:ribosomal protein S16
MGALPQPELAPDEAADRLVARHESDPDWLDAFAEAFERRRSGHEIERILGVWDLSQSEAGRLFGVTRQAVAKWLHEGVPIDRTEQVSNLAAATDLLVRYLKRDRIPAVVRRPASGLGDRSLVELWAAGDTRRLLQMCRELFSFGDAHA